jgi:UDP-glucose 4-epimerase
VQKSNEEWLASHRVNAGGIIGLFEALVKAQRCIPVVFASSAAVYGDGDIPLKESAPCAPLSAYGADKLACEGHARTASGSFGIPCIGLRFFNVYGPRQDPASPYSGVISIFAHRLKQKETLTIYGDGEQARDFIFVGDVVRGVITAMQKLENKTLNFGIFNICTGGRTSINQLADVMANVARTPSSVAHAEGRKADIRISMGDAALAARLLGFRATTSLQDGLKQTFETL